VEKGRRPDIARRCRKVGETSFASSYAPGSRSDQTAASTWLHALGGYERAHRALEALIAIDAWMTTKAGPTEGQSQRSDSDPPGSMVERCIGASRLDIG
jgi:hypothetical protein